MKYAAFLLMFVHCLSLFSQDEETGKPKILNMGFGTFSMKSDLSRSYKTFTPGFAAELRFNKKKRFNGGLAFNYFNVIAESETPNWDEGLSNIPVNFVKTRVVSGEYRLHLNLLKTQKHNLFVSQGFGFAYFQPLDVNGNRLADRTNTRNRNETFSNLSLTLPSSVGYRWLPNEEFGLWLQLKWLRQNSDYFDNLSELSKEKVNDNIFSIQMGVSCVLGLEKKSSEQEGETPTYKHKRYRNKN